LPRFSGIIALGGVFAIAASFWFSNTASRASDEYEPRWTVAPLISRIHPNIARRHSQLSSRTGRRHPGAFMNRKEVIDLSSIGTMFAVLVCDKKRILENSKSAGCD
jgi:hypothetical protein